MHEGIEIKIISNVASLSGLFGPIVQYLNIQTKMIPFLAFYTSIECLQTFSMESFPSLKLKIYLLSIHLNCGLFC